MGHLVVDNNNDPNNALVNSIGGVPVSQNTPTSVQQVLS